MKFSHRSNKFNLHSARLWTVQTVTMLVAAILLLTPPVVAQSANALSATSAKRKKLGRLERTLARSLKKRKALFNHEYRTAHGLGNNRQFSEWGSAGTPFVRFSSIQYADGHSGPSGVARPGSREISNACAAQSQMMENDRQVSDFFWQWGQFLDHDINLTPVTAPGEAYSIDVPMGDPEFDPMHSGTQQIAFSRSAYVMQNGMRQQINTATSFIDASQVYGSDLERLLALRQPDGHGRLRTSPGNYLPYNTEAFPNAPTAEDPTLFFAGDERANEQLGLTAMHTVFVREHNYWVRKLRKSMRRRSAVDVFQLARAIVAAEMQSITYNEFLPLLLGPDALPPYSGYNQNVDPTISNEFATAAYRFGHSMISPQLMRLQRDGAPIVEGNLDLSQAFFRPDKLISEGGVEPILRGLAAQRAQALDAHVVNQLRNFLFGPPGSGGLDLASLNIQRGRDHGLPDFNQLRMDYGLSPLNSFSDVNPDPAVAQELEAAYGSINEIDAWVGGLSEEPYGSGLVGETWHAIIADQFQRLRDGDRFWYQNYFSKRMVRLLERQTLSKIIKRNTKIRHELGANVFVVN